MIPKNPKPVDPPIHITLQETHLDLSAPGKIPFLQAVHFTKAKRQAVDIELIVIHATDGLEKDDRAEHVATWFGGKNKRFDPPRASAHYVIDCDSIVQMVHDKDVAWQAAGANRNGIGIEHAGRAKQSRADWFDEFSAPMLLISAGLVARLCKSYGIPMEFVDQKGLRAKKHGITTHREVTYAFRKGTHTDPGVGFPMDWYIEQVKFAYLKV